MYKQLSKCHELKRILVRPKVIINHKYLSKYKYINVYKPKQISPSYSTLKYKHKSNYLCGLLACWVV